MIFVTTSPRYDQVMEFDAVVVDEVNRAKRTVRRAGGTAVDAMRIVTGIAPGMLQLGPVFIAWTTGAEVLEEMNASWLRPLPVQILEPPTPRGVTLVDRRTGQVTELVEAQGAVECDRFEELLKVIRLATDGGDVLVLCDALPPGAPVDFYARCAAVARERGARTVVSGAGELVRPVLAAAPTVAVLWNADPTGVGAALPANDESMIATVDGGTVDFRVGRASYRATAPTSPQPAAFVAGLAIAVERNQPPEAALHYALACGVAAALRNSAEESLREEDILRLGQQLSLHRIG